MNYSVLLIPRRTFAFLITLTLVFSVFLLWSGEKQKGGLLLLWEVTHQDLPGKLFLAGSIHAAQKEFYPLDSTYDKAWKESKVVCFEIADQNAEDLSKAFLKYGLYPQGQKLSQKCSFMEFQKICAFFMQHDKQYTAAVLDRFRPWALYMQSARILLQKFPQYRFEYGMERVFSHHLGKRHLMGLESVDSQIRSISTVPDMVGVKLLLETISSREKAGRDLKRMTLSLQNGSIRPLEEMIREVEVKYPSFHQALFVERNRRMTEKIFPFLRKKQTVFVLVGAGHFAGKENILQLLRQRKCVIKQLKRSGTKGMFTPPSGK